MILNRIGLFQTTLETKTPRLPEFALARARAALEIGHDTVLAAPRYAGLVSDHERRQYALALARSEPRAALPWLRPGESALRAACLLAAGDTGGAMDALRPLDPMLSKSKDLHAIFAAVHIQAGEFSRARKYLKYVLTNTCMDDIADDSPLKMADFVGKKCTRAAGGALVSVIVCARDAQSTISLALSSVAAQAYRDIEIIAIDDGSSDHTFQHMLRMARVDPRITVHRFPNNGAYASRNIGMRLAKGDFITFLDADDIMLPHRVAAQVAQLERTGAHAAVSRLIRLSEDGRLVAPRIYPYIRHNPCSLMLRRSAALAVGDFEEVRMGADEEYEHRIGLLLGRDAVTRSADVQTLALHRGTSLTQAPDSGLNSPRGRRARIAYREAWVRRHARAARP